MTNKVHALKGTYKKLEVKWLNEVYKWTQSIIKLKNYGKSKTTFDGNSRTSKR